MGGVSRDNSLRGRISIDRQPPSPRKDPEPWDSNTLSTSGEEGPPGGQGHTDTSPPPRGPARTQLLAREWQEGHVPVQVLVEVEAQETQFLLDALDFLKEEDGRKIGGQGHGGGFREKRRMRQTRGGRWERKGLGS